MLRIIRWTVLAFVLTAMGLPAIAQTNQEAASPPGAEGEKKQLLPSSQQEKQERRDQYWYLIAGVANVWPLLKESEAEINRDIDGLFGNVLPRWNEPKTFKDMRDDFMLWDIHLGLGRSLSEKWSIFSTAGAIQGVAPTKNDYFPLGLPIEVYTKFERKVWFVSAGVDYYPWRKPWISEKGKGNNGLTKRLFAARPYVEGGMGYVNIYTVGQSKIALPFFGDIAKVKHAEYYDLFYLSPRLGVDIPLTNKTHLSLMGGYLFFTSHPDEYNSQSYYILFKHKF